VAGREKNNVSGYIQHRTITQRINKPLSKTIAGKISPAAADTCGIESARANVGGT
jgi:hypothetical protein